MARKSAAVREPVVTSFVPRRTAQKSKPDAHYFKKIQRAAILLKQVSDPTRLQAIAMLAEGERHVGAICDELNMSQPAVSHHLALLRHGGIIQPRREGKNSFYGLTEAGERLAAVVEAIMRGSA